MTWSGKRNFSLTDPSNSERQERKSAFIVGAVLLLIAAWNTWRGRPMVYWPAGAAGLALLLTGLLSASGSHKFHGLWMRLAHALGYVNSRILLSAIYFVVMTPYGLVLRVLGRDTMNRRRSKRPSYWIPKSKTRQSREQFERLF